MEFTQFFDAPEFICARRPVHRWTGPKSPPRIIGYDNSLIKETDAYTIYVEIPKTANTAFKFHFYDKSIFLYRKKEYVHSISVSINSKGIHRASQIKEEAKYVDNKRVSILVGDTALKVAPIKEYSLRIDKKMLVKFLKNVDATPQNMLSENFVNTLKELVQKIISLPT